MNTKSIIDRLWNEPPVFFPLLALFHIFLLGQGAVDFVSHPSSLEIQLEFAWYLFSCIFAIGVWFLKRWAAIGYLLIAATGIVLMLVFPNGSFWFESGETLFPVNAIFMLLIFFFYKRFR